MISLARARPTTRHTGSRLYENWGSLTNSSFNQIERSEIVPPGGSKALRDFQRAPSPEKQTPGPGTYDDTAAATVRYPRSPSPPVSTLPRRILTAERDNGVPGPGSYERPDEGTFEHRSAVKDPLKGPTKEEAELHNMRRRVAAVEKLLKAPATALSASARVIRKQEEGRLAALRERVDALRRRVRQQRARRKHIAEARAETKAPPFSSKQRRFFDPLQPRPKTSPAPGAYTAHPTHSEFGFANRHRAPGASRGTQRPPINKMAIHEGYATTTVDVPDLGPGEYTPDLLMSAPDGVPRTKTDLAGSPSGFAAAASASPVAFGSSVRASSPSSSLILGFRPPSKRAMSKPLPLRPGSVGGTTEQRAVPRAWRPPATPIMVGREVTPGGVGGTESMRASPTSRSPESPFFPSGGAPSPGSPSASDSFWASPEGSLSPEVGDSRMLASMSLSRTFTPEDGLGGLGGASRLDTTSGLLMPRAKRKEPKIPPRRTYLQAKAKEAAERRREVDRRAEIETIEGLDGWLENYQKRTRGKERAAAAAAEAAAQEASTAAAAEEGDGGTHK